MLVEKAKALTLSNYTDESAKAVSEALTAALEILEKDKPGQAEVLAAANSLKSALDGLVKKNASTETNSPENPEDSEEGSENDGENSGGEGTEAPGTGDSFPAGLWTSILVLAFSAIVLAVQKKRKMSAD